MDKFDYTRLILYNKLTKIITQIRLDPFIQSSN